VLIVSRRIAFALTLATSPLLFAQLPAEEMARRQAHAERIRSRQEEFYRQRAWPGTSIPAGARAAALAEMDRMIERERKATPGASGPVWTSIGPRPTNVLAEFGPGGNGSPYSAGRVAALAVDPRNPDVAYMGAAGGGVWKTTDGGANWTPLTDDQPSLATGSIALAPSNPDVVYVGTGEQNNSGDSYYGAGILKSTDGGATWTQLAKPFVGPFSTSRVNGGGARIGAIAVHPANPNLVLAAVDITPPILAGIYRSTDGGASWTQVLPGAVGTDVVFQPADPNTVYAALGSLGTNTSNGIYKSSDSGATWTRSNGTAPAILPAANVGRITLALAPSSPNTIYAGIASSTASSLLGLFKTTDGGQTWNRLAAPDYCNPQCFYDNVVRVHPTNPNVVVAAGLPPYRSLDGGTTWTNIAVGPDGLAAHTDHHALAFAADGSRLYDGSDGGVFSTASFASASPAWKNLNATLAITEFSTNIAIHPDDPKRAYGGTQDNGTQLYSGNLAWDEVVGGDGGATAIDPAVPSIWYGAFQGPQVYRLSGVTSFNTINTPFLGTSPLVWNGFLLTDRFSSYPPLVMDPSNPQRLYFPSQRLYQTDDGAGTWAAVSPDLTGNAGTISAIAVSSANSQAVAVGTNSGRFQITDSPRQGATTPWVERSSGLPGRPISQVVFDPVQPLTLYAVASGFHIAPVGTVIGGDGPGHVFKTTDYGQTWTDITGNLPNVPCNDIVVDPDVPGTLYLATDIGVFQTQDDGAIWTTLSNGLPRVLVRALALHRPSRTLRAATYGRGMWDLSVPLSGPSAAPHIDSFSPATINSGAAATVTVSGANFRADSRVRWNGADRPATFVNATSLRVALSAADLASTGRSTLIVFNPVAGGGLSNAVNVAVGPPPAFTSSGITSVANPVAAPLVPGSLSSLFGTNLAPVTVSVSPSPALPTMLGGVTVEVGGFPAALFFVSPSQINFQVPWELEGFERTTLTVVNGTLASAPLQVNVVPASPTLFSTSGAGAGQGAILIAGPEVLAAPAGAFTGSRPVRRGEFLEIYATGLGPVSRLQGDGSPKTATPPAISRTPIVTIGGVPATVSFSGLTPGAVGLFQVNVQVPDGVASGNGVPVSITVYGVTSNTVTVAVQ
jgi:uncharacterized protein (TIGR03437 family)